MSEVTVDISIDEKDLPLWMVNRLRSRIRYELEQNPALPLDESLVCLRPLSDSSVVYLFTVTGVVREPETKFEIELRSEGRALLAEHLQKHGNIGISSPGEVRFVVKG